MNQKTYRQYLIAIAVGIAAVIGAASLMLDIEHAYPVALAAVLLGMLGAYILRKRVDGALVDERVHAVDTRAARSALSLFSLSALIIAVPLVLGGDGTLYIAGITLSFALCALLLMYYGYYVYYERRN